MSIVAVTADLSPLRRPIFATTNALYRVSCSAKPASACVPSFTSAVERATLVRARVMYVTSNPKTSEVSSQFRQQTADVSPSEHGQHALSPVHV